MTIARVTLHRQRERRIAAGHLWVYDNEIDGLVGSPAPGDVVDVAGRDGRFLGRGFFNPYSKIRVRLVTCEDEPIDDAFFARRLDRALALRRLVVSGTTANRVVFGEADGLPGLIVDRYGDLLAAQTSSVGMERRRDLLGEMLLAATGARAVYLCNDASARDVEGLPRYREFLRGRGDTVVEIEEGPARFQVDVSRGQKTGWFCDQRENRLAAADLAPGADALEVFSYTGGFGIQAALRGAVRVEGIDTSEDAVRQATAHAARNGVADRCRYRRADAFEALRALDAAGARYDWISLDPPAFARRKAAVAQAIAGYKEINLRAMRLLRPGGFLVTSTCSYHVDPSTFWDVVVEAAEDAGSRLRLIEARAQARDHPSLPAMPETFYLKCLILQIK